MPDGTGGEVARLLLYLFYSGHECDVIAGDDPRNRLVDGSWGGLRDEAVAARLPRQYVRIEHFLITDKPQMNRVTGGVLGTYGRSVVRPEMDFTNDSVVKEFSGAAQIRGSRHR